jgi:hypothetical protein
MTVVWHTDVPTDTVVRYGVAPGPLTETVKLATPTNIHVAAVTGLKTSTRYAYSVGSTAQTLGSGADLTFRTDPPGGQPRPFRFFAWGDSGDQSSAQREVARRMDEQALRPDFALILGDIIYPGGEPWNYDSRFFQPYSGLLRNTVIWPTLGNHDASFFNGQPYFDNFYLPRNNPAKVENYYSFDYAHAHFACLDSQNELKAPAAMVAWLDRDLAASKATFKFVYFHHPPYSGGTHADNGTVQQQFLPTFEKHGVDMVLCGHSHVYERSYLLKGGAVLQKDPASYQKINTPDGTLYVVSGAGGKMGALSNPSHRLMAIQKGNVAGNTVVDVDGKTLHGFYVLRDGSAIDLFALTKDGDRDPPRIAAFSAGPPATRLSLVFSEPVLAGGAAFGAERTASYAISPSVAVQSAKLASDGRTLTLTTAAHPDGTYALTVSQVQDRAAPGNTMVAQTVGYSFGSAVASDAGASTSDAGRADAEDRPPDAGAAVPDGGEETPDADGVDSPPYAEEPEPAPDSAHETSPADLSVHVRDDGPGVAAPAIRMSVNGKSVSPEISGTPADRLVKLKGPWPKGKVTVEVTAKNVRDLAMTPFVWSFTIGKENPGQTDAGGLPDASSVSPGLDAGGDAGADASASSTEPAAGSCGCTAGPFRVAPALMLVASALLRRRRCSSS